MGFKNMLLRLYSVFLVVCMYKFYRSLITHTATQSEYGLLLYYRVYEIEIILSIIVVDRVLIACT